MKKSTPSLSEIYEDYFVIGAAVNNRTLISHRDLLKKHFKSFTAENEMKPISINREKGKYSFEWADLMVELSRENNKLLRGHTIVWHNQTPDHFFLDETGAKVSSEILFERLKEYMRTVFNHFSNKVYCWDIVNEAIEDKGTCLFRNTKWLEIFGKNYIDEVFTLARELNPESKLFYNDYDAVLPKKRDKIYKLLKGMKDRGIPLDGVGIQAHWNIYDFKYDDIKEAIEKYASLGLDIHITELDVSIFSRKEKDLKYDEPPKERMKIQSEFYKNIFKIFREYSEHISNVTLWGIADDSSWLDKFRIERKNWALLFDENHQAKEAFWKIIDF